MSKLSVYLFILFTLRPALAQVSGDFWWLHKETENINGKKIPVPKFENLTNENDEYDKITFKRHPKQLDNSRDKKNNTLNKKSNDEKSKSWIVHFPDWNDFVSANLYQDNKNHLNNNVTVERNVTEEVDRDIFTFDFSDEDIEKKMWSVNASTSTSTRSNRPSLEAITTETSLSWINNMSEIKQHNNNYKNLTDKHKLVFRVDVNYNPKSESICTFISKEECLYKNGHVYKYLKRYNPKDKALVCCILPLKQSQKEGKESQSERIVFPEYSEHLSDNKRTTRDIAKISSIVTSGNDYDEDPYANIRNHKVSKPKITNRYGQTDYTTNDYIDEVPTPGMLGHYNADDGDDYDYWSSYSDYDYDSVVSEENGSLEQGYGVQTSNPRLGDRPGGITKKPKVKPNRFATTSTDDLTVQVANHVINYHSNPDFLVLKGYKLLNLVKNSTRLPSQPSKSTTELVLQSNEYSGEDYSSSGPQYQYSCGYEDYSEENNGYSRQNSAAGGRQPWLGIVSRNRQTRKTFCYATLIHPRAAITVASCVYGSKAGEITFYIGSKRNVQRRVANIRLNKSSGSSVQNTAILYWSQPLVVNSGVRPACLDNPNIGEVCHFQAWSLKDRGSQSPARPIRAVFLKTKDCTGGRPQAFCAALKGDGLVPQLGGALVCNRQGRQAAVGVMAQRSGTPKLPQSQIAVLPIRQWTLNQLQTLGLV